MIETKSHDYAWSKSWIEFKAPNAQGVYWLRDKEGKTIFVGKPRLNRGWRIHRGFCDGCDQGWFGRGALWAPGLLLAWREKNRATRHGLREGRVLPCAETTLLRSRGAAGSGVELAA
ncbi:MAG TPA: hypothetical protein VNG91_06115 [Terriglobia bacterium]|nr:hypothetical protein [Terriglobia bacterium]